jgi:plastocyanin domain-containing protein
MRSWIKVLAVLLIGLVVIGFFRGWFSVSSPPPQKTDAEGDKVNVTVTVDKAKVKSDVRKVERKVKEEIRELQGKVKPKEEQN